MNTHVLTMRDGSEYWITSEQFDKVTEAVDAKNNFYLKSDYLSYFEVRSVKRVVSSMERPLFRLDEPKEIGMTKAGRTTNEYREGIEQKIRETLYAIDPSERHRRQYLATIKLAKHLHTDTGTWGLKGWEVFTAEHPDSTKELELLTNPQ